MTNTTAANILAVAAAITSHDEWVAFFSNTAHITAFAASVLDAKTLAAAVDGDYYDRLHLAGELKNVLLLEAASEAELARREADALAETGWNACEGKYEPYYYWSAQEDLHRIAALREFRADQAAQAAWSAAPVEAHLTYRPFAALAG